MTDRSRLHPLGHALRHPVASTIMALLVIALAWGLRLHQIDAQSLWNDEGTSVVMAARNAADILTHTAADIHPPGYYLLLSGWTRLAGTSELALRVLSALQSTLTVAFVIALGRRLFGRPAGWLAGLLLALNSFAIYYGQETRMYAQLGLLATVALWALVMWVTSDAQEERQEAGGERQASTPDHQRPTTNSQRPTYLLLLALLNTAGLYTHYAYPFSMLAQGVIFLAYWLPRRDRRTFGLYVAANLLTLLFFAPWAGEAIRQVTTWPNTGDGTSLATALRSLLFGLTAQGSAHWLALFGALALAAAGLWRLRANPLRAAPASWAAITVGAFVLLGLRPDDLKQLTPAASAMALWLGGGAALLWRDGCRNNRLLASVALVALVVMLVSLLPPLYHDPGYARADYRGMAARIMADARPDDAIILNGPGQGEVWWYYYTGDAPVYPLPRGLGGDDAATQAEMTAILGQHRRVYALYWGDAERDPNRIVESALTAGAFEVAATWYGDVRFVTYAVPAQPATAPTDTLDLAFPTGPDDPTITLHGYALDRTTCQPGDVVTLTLFWRTDGALTARYKVFVHVYQDANAPPPAQHDAEPAGGLAPTTTWATGDLITDRHGILLPVDLPPGEYTLAVGLYDANDPARRLASAAGERVPLATVTVSSED